MDHSWKTILQMLEQINSQLQDMANHQKRVLARLEGLDTSKPGLPEGWRVIDGGVQE